MSMWSLSSKGTNLVPFWFDSMEKIAVRIGPYPKVPATFPLFLAFPALLQVHYKNIKIRNTRVHALFSWKIVNGH